MRRVRSHIREAVREAIRHRKVSDLGEQRTGVDPLKRPAANPPFISTRPQASGILSCQGIKVINAAIAFASRVAAREEAAQSGDPDGDGEDPFVFKLSREEFLDLFFEDLGTSQPSEAKAQDDRFSSRSRAGYAKRWVAKSPEQTGNHAPEPVPKNCSRASRLRCLLAWPKQELEQAEQEGDAEQVARLRLLVEQIRTRMRAITFLDKVDLRYNRFEPRPKATTQAVMFCLMDTSASMTESLKDLAKRFYMLLHLFLDTPLSIGRDRFHSSHLHRIGS